MNIINKSNKSGSNSPKSKNSSKSSEHSISLQKSIVVNTHHTNGSFTSQNTVGKDNHQWLDEMVQQRRVKFIPYEEFEDERIEEKSEFGIVRFMKTVHWKKMRKRVVVKELEYVDNLPEETREAFVNEVYYYLFIYHHHYLLLFQY